MAMVVGLLAIVFERVGIEEAVAGKRDTTQETIIERALENIHVFAIAGHQEHAVVPEHEGNGGAGFIVTTVRQFIVVAIGLAGTAGPHAAGEVEFLAHHVFPDGVDGGQILLIALERGDIGHAGVKVIGAHRVAHGLGLLRHGQVVLAVLGAGAAATAGFEEDPCQVEPALVAGLAVKFGEAHLHHLVTGGDRQLAIAEVTLQQLRALEADLHERIRTGGLGMGDAGLIHVAEVVEFVAEFGVLEPALLMQPRMARRIRVHGAEREQVAIRLLRGSHALDDLFHALGQRGVRLHAVGKRGTLQHLGHVRVIERVLGGRLVLEILLAGSPAAHRFRGEVEIEQAFRRLKLLQREGQGHAVVDFLPLVPQAIGKADIGEGDRFHGIIGSHRGKWQQTACGQPECRETRWQA